MSEGGREESGMHLSRERERVHECIWSPDTACRAGRCCQAMAAAPTRHYSATNAMRLHAYSPWYHACLNVAHDDKGKDSIHREVYHQADRLREHKEAKPAQNARLREA